MILAGESSHAHRKDLCNILSSDVPSRHDTIHSQALVLSMLQSLNQGGGEKGERRGAEGGGGGGEERGGGGGGE